MIYLECNPDELLCKMLGVPKKQTKHHNDKGRICNYLVRQNGEIGLVDEDPHATPPTSIASFTKSGNRTHAIDVLTDKKGNKLVVLCPRLEGWLLYTCKQNGLDIKFFNLSEKENRLHNEMNSKLRELEKLLSHLLKIKAPEILYLQSLLK